VRPVNIQEFYDADERRRASAEVELGQDWRDAADVRYELSWIADTGELYVMLEAPAKQDWADPFGGIHVHHSPSADEAEVEGMTVVVVADVGSRDQIEEVLAGWQDAMSRPDSVAWLVKRLRDHGVAVFGDPETSGSV
jgi:hypothetical protein